VGIGNWAFQNEIDVIQVEGVRSTTQASDSIKEREREREDERQSNWRGAGVLIRADVWCEMKRKGEGFENEKIDGLGKKRDFCANQLFRKSFETTRDDKVKVCLPSSD
jgi:hypothetical protein